MDSAWTVDDAGVVDDSEGATAAGAGTTEEASAEDSCSFGVVVGDAVVEVSGCVAVGLESDFSLSAGFAADGDVTAVDGLDV
jgi:hypothetical protein